MRRPTRLSLLGLLLLLPLAPATAAGAPAITFGKQGLTATGATSGGTVVWFGLAQEVVAYEPSYTRYQLAVPADGAGNAVLDLGKPVPRRSLWVAVDLASGAYAIAAPAGFPLVQTDLPAAALTSRSTAADQLADEADGSDLLFVRPGQGAWAALVGRGGQLDEGLPGERTVRVSLDRLDPIAAAFSSPPAKAAPRDLLIILHPQTLSAAVAVVGPKP